METVFLDMYQSAAIGAVVLVAGLFLVWHFRILKKYCVPAAVVGGLLFSVFTLVLHDADIATLEFDRTIRDLTMTMFFCSVGFMSSLSMMKRGGRLMLIMVAIVGAMVIVQDVIGIVAVSSMDLDPKFGLVLGSISLFGGHGTAAAYGDILVNQYGLVGADVVAVAAATFGLAIAGIIGGPLGRRLIVRNGLKPTADHMEYEDEEDVPIVNNNFLKAVVALLVCMGIGTLINGFFSSVGVTLPGYLGALIVAIIVKNVCDAKGLPLPDREIGILGWVSVCMFLSMALMSLELWQLVDLAIPMVVVLCIQTVVLTAVVYFVVFKATGKTFESAALSAGMMGFGMGATPNAVANMDAIIKEHGPAPEAYFIIPMIGGVFLDIINVVVLTFFLNTL